MKLTKLYKCVNNDWYLEKVDILSQLLQDQYPSLQQNIREKSYKSGEIIFKPDDPGDEVYLIKQGRVKLYSISYSGKESILFMFYPGEFFGLSEILGSERRVCFAEAEEPTRLSVISCKQFEELIYKNPTISRTIIKILGIRLMQMCKTMEVLSSENLRARIALALIKLEKSCGIEMGNEMLIDRKITHRTIAAMVGSSRQGVTEVLNKFIKEGMIKYDSKKRIVILKHPELIDSIVS